MQTRKFLIVLVLCTARAASGQEEKADALRITPEAVQPGGLIEVATNLGDDSLAIEASIGEQRLVHVGTSRSGSARFFVPLLPPAKVEVVVRVGRERIGAGVISILPSRAQRVLFGFDGKSVKLLSVKATAGGVSEGAERSGRRLSCDLVSRRGEVLFSRSIPHPTAGRMEVFEAEGRMRQVPRSRFAFVSIKLPRTDGTATLRLYDVASGVDLSTKAGRENRRFLSEFRILERR